MSEILSQAELDAFERKFSVCTCGDCRRALQKIQAVKAVRREKELEAEIAKLKAEIRELNASNVNTQFGEGFGNTSLLHLP